MGKSMEVKDCSVWIVKRKEALLIVRDRILSFCLITNKRFSQSQMAAAGIPGSIVKQISIDCSCFPMFEGVKKIEAMTYLANAVAEWNLNIQLIEKYKCNKKESKAWHLQIDRLGAARRWREKNPDAREYVGETSRRKQL